MKKLNKSNTKGGILFFSKLFPQIFLRIKTFNLFNNSKLTTNLTKIPKCRI